MVNALNLSALPVQGRSLPQLLHGYAEGHRLLESSFTPQDDLTRLMLRMSDLSGSSMASGFEDYITGYPLSSINSYALAKTWNAPEMPRPGCVWTHTIVIPATILSELSDLSSLVALFRRPVKDAYRGQYSKNLLLGNFPTENASKPISQSELEQLLWTYYGVANRPIILSATTSAEFQSMIFALWSQEWPSLRTGFTFCTGSLSTRTFAGRPFDIQCVPATLTREVVLETNASTSVEPVLLAQMPGDIPQWMASVVSDAINPQGGLIRKFLWEASDSTSTRAEFIPFIKVFDALREPHDVAALVALIAQLFPQPTAGAGLKRLVLGNQSAHEWSSTHKEQDLLFALATTSNYQSFDAEALSIRERCVNLCVQKPDSASWLVGELFRSSLNPLGEELLAGLISAMEPETALRVTSQQLQFLPALFRAKPALAASSQLWLAGGDRKRELFDSVASHKHLDCDLITGVVNALLDSRSDIFIRRALDLWGKDAVFPTLDWIEAHNASMSEECRGALTFHLPAVMEWIEARPSRSFESLVAVAHVVAPYSYKISQYDSAVWLRTLNSLQDCPQEGEKSYISTFLLALAFGNAPPSPLDLVSESFERVHEAARRELLSDSAWIIIEPLVPELSWLSNWDKCERLRRGLISAFVRHRWPASELKRRIKDYELVRQLLRSARRVDGGEDYFRNLHLAV